VQVGPHREHEALLEQLLLDRLVVAGLDGLVDHGGKVRERGDVGATRCGVRELLHARVVGEFGGSRLRSGRRFRCRSDRRDRDWLPYDGGEELRDGRRRRGVARLWEETLLDEVAPGSGHGGIGYAEGLGDLGLRHFGVHEHPCPGLLVAGLS
jgi:hypothetical protein